ncbi:uncharacterized protein LOC134189330 [Corticium candelabrum]|uniref:uncharacterized protein LOC134189330 n=1 Tax=Corticium candelabrum TaxID=121492 RepID=UPI002E269A3F|nr:uncharacterized protein LOC134189330 [Corticium candelabrum]
MKQASIICSALLQVNAQSLFKGFASNQSTVSLVTSPLPETHNLAQPLPQFQKFKLVSRVTNKLSTLASEDSGLTFTKRLELLKQLVTVWENGETVAVVNDSTKEKQKMKHTKTKLNKFHQ